MNGMPGVQWYTAEKVHPVALKQSGQYELGCRYRHKSRDRGHFGNRRCVYWRKVHAYGSVDVEFN